MKKTASILIVIGSLLVAGGCQPAPAKPKTSARRVAASSQPAQEYVSRALDFLERADEFDERTAHAQAAYQLNRWLGTQSFSGWKPDDLLNRLPKIVREQGVTNDLPRRQFDELDIRVLQEAVMMRQVAQAAVRRPLDPLFAEWLSANQMRLGNAAADQLGLAYRLFDWTVRNIQLDELLPNPDESTAAAAAGTGENAPAIATAPSAMRGVPGPGYTYEPTQTLVYGHGDTWQRMRVFTLLSRQIGLEAVTLAFPGRTIPPRPRPWVSGVLIGDQLFLFDLKLGMPLVGAGGDGVLTLSEVLADPTLLAKAAIDETHPYRVAPEDLAEVVALLDVVAPNLSHRFALLEKQLVGELRTVLTTPLSATAGKLRVCKGISDIYVWSIPFEAIWYRTAYQRQLKDDQRAFALHMQKYQMFESNSSLLRGRLLYLRGMIDGDDEHQGARAYLMQTRISQDDLTQMATNPEVQQKFGLVRGPTEPDQFWNARLAVYQDVLTRAKQHASFWLGMCQLETGRADAAIEWLNTRTLEPWPDGAWAPLARYNLARAYEVRGEYSKAQQLLLADKSLQEHGNYLRARLIEKRIGGAK